MRELRRIQRYKVEPELRLMVMIPQSFNRRYQLATLSEGGFGFFANVKDSGLVLHPNIDAKFLYEGQTLKLQGIVKYCTFLPKHGMNFFGIEFTQQDSQTTLLIKSIIDGALKKGQLKECENIPQSQKLAR